MLGPSSGRKANAAGQHEYETKEAGEFLPRPEALGKDVPQMPRNDALPKSDLRVWLQVFCLSVAARRLGE